MLVLTIKAVALESVDDHSGLKAVFKVGKTDHGALSLPLLSGNHAKSAVALERPEDVSNFSFSGIGWQSFNVNCLSCVGRDGEET